MGIYSTNHRRYSVKNTQNSVKNWIDWLFIIKKLNTPIGYAFFIILALMNTLFITKLGVLLGSFILVASIGVTIILLCLFNAKVAFFLGLTLSYFLNYILRYFVAYYHKVVPLGIMLDALFFIGAIGIFLNKGRQQDRSFPSINNPITFIFIVYLSFLCIQFFNPNMLVKVGYYSFFRRIVTLYACYIIVLYIIDGKNFIRKFIVFWLVIALIGGAYGCHQEWFGMMPMENKWIHLITMVNGKNPLLHNGVFRKVSFFSDPTAFGMFMATSSILSIILLTGPFKLKQKIVIAIITIICLLGMGYSGTRTAYAMMPAGLILFILMTITNKNTMIIASISVLSFVFLLYAPIYGNQTVNRFRTAFIGSEDASLNLRDMKRKLTQPFVYENPLGGGIETSGVIGRKHDPSHYLASYTIDSGYMKTALETGWIGLVLIMIYYFIPMWIGVKVYYNSDDKEIKTYTVAFVAVIYSLLIATYTQKSINQVPGGIFLYTIFGILGYLYTQLKKNRYT